LPSYNEEANIERAIDQTRAVAERVCSQWEILVVDDGSKDRTAEIVRGASAIDPSIKLVSHSCNRGYGEALRSGFAAAQFDFVFFTDADNQFDMNDFELLVAWADRADVVAGYRKVRRDTFMRQVNAWGWNRLVRMLFYVPVRDIDCAFKLIRREALEQIDIESRGAMINTEIMVKLARNGCLIIEVGVNHFPRTAGAPQGAKLRVIARALREVKKMYPHLSGLAPHAENAGLERRSTATGPATAQLEFDSLAIAQERWGTSVPGPCAESANGHARLVLGEQLDRRTGSSTR
jgi:glycosyltransferase involved in cell wall biosynthesis